MPQSGPFFLPSASIFKQGALTENRLLIKKRKALLLKNGLRRRYHTARDGLTGCIASLCANYFLET